VYVCMYVCVCVCVCMCVCVCVFVEHSRIELKICLERLTHARPAEALFQPVDVDELKIRMGRLECLMARVLNAVEKPLSTTSDTQTQPQVKTEGY